MNNDNYFNILKNKYPNLALFNCQGNTLTFNNKSISLLNLNLKFIDETLYNLSPDNIFFIIGEYVIYENYPNFINEEINYINILLTKNELTLNEETYLKNYIEKFIKKESLLNIFSSKELTDDIQKRRVPIDNAYLPPETKVKSYIQNYFINKAKEGITEGKNNSVEFRRVKYNKAVSHTYDESNIYGDEDLGIKAFVNPLIIICIILIIGMIVGGFIFILK